MKSSVQRLRYAVLGGTAFLALTAVTQAAVSVSNVVVEAESLQVTPSSASTVFADAYAYGAQGVTLNTNAAFNTTIAGSLRSITMRVRGDQCDGAPVAAILIDGAIVAARPVANTIWTDVTVPVAPTAIDQVHTLRVMYANDTATASCNRNLRFDRFTYSVGTDDTTPRVPVATPKPLPTPTPVPTKTATPVPTRTATPLPQKTPTPTPVATTIKRLYVPYPNPATPVVEAWSKTRPADAAQINKIASNSTATWIGGYSNEAGKLNQILTGAAEQQARAVFAIYNIPGRDSGQYSAGGAATATAYRAWIDGIAKRIGNAATLIVLEPDAISFSLPTAALANERYALVKYAATKFAALKDTLVYVDAGTPGWKTPAQMIPRLKASGVDVADGFAVNTSNFHTTSEDIQYGRDLQAGLGSSRHFVIDTSRNGNGPLPGASGESAWCNPPGRALGYRPTMTTGVTGVDAFVWIKRPGESDGACFGNPTAGTFMPEVALGLAKRAGW